MSDNEQPTLLIIDGHSLAFRAFYALPVDSFTTRDGQHTNAIHGFLSMLLLLLKNEKPTHIAVAFDMSRHSFRTDEYPEYKGTRGETPPEFSGQVPLLKDALKAMNITTLEKEGFEADDILATLSVQGAEQGYRVLVVSGDRDTIQLVNDRVTLLYPSRQGVTDLTRYDRDKVFERYGIEPHQYPEIAALVGETSDNLPGIPKVGEKTAVKWLNQFGSLDEILRRSDEIGGKVGESLREFQENAVRNRRLNRLLTDVELEHGPADFDRRAIDEDAVRDLFARLEFRTLLERVFKLDGIETGTGGAGGSGGPGPGGVGSSSLVDIKAVVAPVPQNIVGAELAEWFDRVTVAEPFGLALSTELLDGKPIGFGVAASDSAVFLPWSPDSASLLPFENWLASDAPKILHGAKVQLKALLTAGLTVSGVAFDTSVAAWLLKSDTASPTLADLVDRMLAETLPSPDPNQLVPDDDSVIGPAVQAWFVGRVARALDAKLDDGSRSVLVDIEMPVLVVLAQMELDGVAVSHPQLSELSAELTARSTDLATQAFAIIEREINLGSPKQIQEVLFDQLGMPKTRATKTGYSTDAVSLADLQASSPHPFLDLLLLHRDATKLNQIVETLDKSIAPDRRIHTTYVQTGSSTGRISSTDPNLQNIPVRTEEGRRIRKAFIVGESYETLLTTDYSQIEMRIMAHLSEDAGLIAAFQSGEDLHRFVGARIFGVAPSDVTSAMRSKVKAMSYGLAYGLSAFGLSKQLRIPTAEAKQLMGDYFERFGAVRDYLRNVVVQAREDGYTETIFGRRRMFPDLNSGNRVLRDNAERQALNAPIQGTAADILKIAMVNIAADMASHGLQSRMLLQVHDELVFDVYPGEWDALAAIVTARMSTAADLKVPLDVQLGRGQNWNEAAH
ncbi:DNA polymerase I [Subtercola boreus]|uniref:DNA polymerase I n=1 Tax=Subtercola boreus TaxID=120213 RepID=A0A3E0WD27_9MICO|nr:DNA polymerase I [Subtercola boreus]RFA21277.1 DNA polymerase I [Subtercola boreus]RFA21660.1 DNA polymerase I [Subtercola boreus]RFA27630.1 DNA polymerase I [Subtercola boreus]